MGTILTDSSLFGLFARKYPDVCLCLTGYNLIFILRFEDINILLL